MTQAPVRPPLYMRRAAFDPDPELAEIRDSTPVREVRTVFNTSAYLLTRYDDIWHVSRNPQLFCSGKGSNIGDMPVEINEFFGSMINMDDPKHFRLRSIVSKGFTPKEVAKVEEYVKVKAARIVDDLLERFPGGSCDFVTEVAAPLPLKIICEMMGIPEADEPQIFAWTNIILGIGDPERFFRQLGAAGRGGRQRDRAACC